MLFRQHQVEGEATPSLSGSIFAFFRGGSKEGRLRRGETLPKQSALKMLFYLFISLEEKSL